jgi:hypothetical protein
MNPVQLAFRVLRVDRRTQVSTVLTAMGVAVATGLVMLLVALPFATEARAERAVWQDPSLSMYQGGADGKVSWASSDDVLDDRPIIRIDVAPLADPADVRLPAGIDELPGPGEMLQSPELARLSGELPRERLADRFDAKPVGLLGDEALRFPEQLVVLVGHSPDTMPSSATELTGLTATDAEPDPLLSLLAGVGVVVLLVPSLVLVASASRLTAARRERRLAALRLAGATPKQVMTMVAAETGIAALAGAVLGVLASPGLHALATLVPWDGGTWYAGDFSLPPWIVAVIALTIPVLVVGAAVLGLRRVVNTPLMAAGGHTRKPLSMARLLFVPAAAALFFFSLTQTDSSMAFLPILVSLGLLMWSPTVVGPWVTSALGGLFVRTWRRPAALLAGRRLRDDPKAAYRASAGVVLAVFAGSMALTLMPSLESEAGYYSEFREDVPYVQTDDERAGQIVSATDAVLRDYGLDQRAVQVGQVNLSLGVDGWYTGYVVACADATALLPQFEGVPCASGPAVYTPAGVDLAGLRADSAPAGDSSGTATVPLPADARHVPVETAGAVLIDPTLLPDDATITQVMVAVPAGPADAERARTALLNGAGGAQVISKVMKLSEQNTELADLRRVTVIGLVTASLLAGISAAIATAGSVMDRRRTFGALLAAGTPVRTLSRALRAEAALPALVSTIAAGALGTAVGVGLFGLVSQSVPVFSPWLAAPVVLGALVALLAASVCTPALKRVRAEPLADE